MVPFSKGSSSWSKLSVGVTTFILVVLCNLLFFNSSWAYTTIYQKSVFQVIRVVYDHTFGWLPFPSIYYILPLFIWYFLFKKGHTLKSLFLAVFTALLWLVNLFYLLWGFNYAQPSVYQTLEFEPITIDSTYISRAFHTQTRLVSQLSSQSLTELPRKEVEDNIRELQEGLLSEWGIPTLGRVRIRHLPPGSLLRLRTSGIYIPHAIEGHIDAGLFYKQHPFTMAHEMAHGYGFTDESVCNFIGFLTCIKSDEPLIRYSAELAYWRYLARAYRAHHRSEWADTYNNLPANIKDDLEAISKHVNRYKDLMPKARDKIYDQYLKSHGVSAGIASYDQIVNLVAAYRYDNDILDTNTK